MVRPNRETPPSPERWGLPLVQRWFRTLVDIWQEALFPAVCIHCRRYLHLEAAGSVPARSVTTQKEIFCALFCPACMDAIRLIRSPKCSVCGMPFWGDGESDHVCGQCDIQPRPFASAEAVGVYDGPLRSAVHALKYDGKLRVARILGRSLALHFAASGLRRTVDLIVPVPLHPVRLRKRGFNQSILLIQGWEKWLPADEKGCCSPVIHIEALRRIRNTRPQMSLGRKERQTNIIGAFDLHPGAVVEGKRVLLVDDVLTTGATVAECATVLLKAGAAKVDVLTVARTIEP
ncbi:MAG: ComF family protein [Thermodesulfobacteriota bacterium]